MEKFDTIISACLLGIPCRYNHKGECNKKALDEYLKGKSIAVCPEIISGQKTPRPACEIVGGDGFGVLNGQAKVLDKTGNDYSKQFIRGAEIILNEIAKKHSIKKAILKSNSPSCGCGTIYSGKFNGKKVKGHGVLSALLKENGINDIKEL